VDRTRPGDLYVLDLDGYAVVRNLVQLECQGLSSVLLVRAHDEKLSLMRENANSTNVVR